MISGTPQGYSILIFSHHALSSELEDTRWNYKMGCENILAPYRDQIICCICGHVHDDLCETKNGILYLSTTLASCSTDINGNARTIDTENETSFDNFVIDQTGKRIYAFRYGYGNNREFDFDNTSSTFGEVL